MTQNTQENKAWNQDNGSTKQISEHQKNSITYPKPMSDLVHNRKRFAQTLSKIVKDTVFFIMLSEFLRARCH